MAKLIKIHLWYGDEINDWEKLWNPTVWVDPLKLYVLLRLRLIIFQTRSVSRFILHILQIHPVKAGHKHPLPLQIMHHNQCLFKQTSVIPSKHGLVCSFQSKKPPHWAPLNIDILFHLNIQSIYWWLIMPANIIFYNSSAKIQDSKLTFKSSAQILLFLLSL